MAQLGCNCFVRCDLLGGGDMILVGMMYWRRFEHLGTEQSTSVLAGDRLHHHYISQGNSFMASSIAARSCSGRQQAE